MPKLTIIGAGSFVFARRIITDMMTYDSLKDSLIVLMDVDERKLSIITKIANRMVKQEDSSIKIESTTNLIKACQDANYVATTIRVGNNWNNIMIPRKYGIDYAVGDTSGIAGTFYFLRNAPAMMRIAKVIEEVAPNALLLNYTNPMTMLSKVILDETSIDYVGLCHSVQGTAEQLAEYLNLPFGDISYKVAGINHMAWFLEFKFQGKNAYPLLWKVLDDPAVYERDVVRFELMKYFGAFVTESSIHTSEYNAFFRRTPEMIDKYTNEKMWGVISKEWDSQEKMKYYENMRKEQEKEDLLFANGSKEIPIERSKEYFTRILNAIETNNPYVFNGNVKNNGLITNLQKDSVVEVPIMVDANGLNPCYVGALPPVLAAYDQINLQIQELAVKGYVEKNRKYIYHAALLDPLVSSQLEMSEIYQMVDEMFLADAEYVNF